MPEAVKVTIMGQVFSVSSDDGEEHLRRVASLVDDKMREITDVGRVASSYAAAVLTALNIASEYQKLRDEQVEIEATIERLTARLGENPKGQE
jgi:cell division protein ZapA